MLLEQVLLGELALFGQFQMRPRVRGGRRLRRGVVEVGVPQHLRWLADLVVHRVLGEKVTAQGRPLRVRQAGQVDIDLLVAP